MLLVLGYCVGVYLTADGRVQELCRAIKPGMTLAELNAFAKSAGLGPQARPNGESSLVEDRTFGRYGCRVDVRDNEVKAVRFEYRN